MNSEENVYKETPPCVFTMDNLEILLVNIVDRARGNASGAILEKFIKPRVTIILFHLAYSLYKTRLLIAVSGTHEEFSTVILGYG